jgi:type IV secretory pathway VirB2 component (pilin)
MLTVSLSQSGGSPLAESASWVSQLLTGPLATLIAVLAIALVGFAALQGRFNWRNGTRVVVGCFIVFGAGSIAAALLASGLGDESRVIEVARTLPPAAVAVPTRPPVFDPYAGASVPNQ